MLSRSRKDNACAIARTACITHQGDPNPEQSHLLSTSNRPVQARKRTTPVQLIGLAPAMQAANVYVQIWYPGLASIDREFHTRPLLSRCWACVTTLRPDLSADKTVNHARSMDVVCTMHTFEYVSARCSDVPQPVYTLNRTRLLLSDRRARCKLIN